MGMVDIVMTKNWFPAPKICPVADFWEFGTVSRPGGLQADLLVSLGGRASQRKGKLHFARKCRSCVFEWLRVGGSNYFVFAKGNFDISFASSTTLSHVGLHQISMYDVCTDTD